ncbi:MAG TPA: MgtC/SapB family protein [Actinomycetota bacterium]|nr:MgtC/SapB family protein [Actinomycetota bacterium]
MDLDLLFQVELAGRLALAALAGALVGVERELRDQAAGLRTHMLVSVGAALFTIVSVYGFEDAAAGQVQARYDITRVASNIVTGVGFLGAGTIIRQGFSIRGLTTAASLWVVAAVGTAAGVGMYWVTWFTVLLTLISLWGLRRVRRRLRQAAGIDREVVTVHANSEEVLDEVVDLLRARGHRIRGMDLEDLEEQEGVHARLRITRSRGESIDEVLAAICRITGVQGAEVES